MEQTTDLIGTVPHETLRGSLIRHVIDSHGELLMKMIREVPMEPLQNYRPVW